MEDGTGAVVANVVVLGQVVLVTGVAAVLGRVRVGDAVVAVVVVVMSEGFHLGTPLKSDSLNDVGKKV